ncbi:MAG: dihydroorotase [Acidobacteriota bacterium]
MKLLIKNGRLIDPCSNIDDTLDILIEDGKIKEIKEKIQDKEAEVIDATRLVVCPGFIDIHTHLREPGREDEETIESGSQAAAAGGFTSICCMANTEPPNDKKEVTEFILRRSKEIGIVNVFPVASVTKGLKGEEITEMAELKENGAVAFSDDGVSVKDSLVLRRAMEWIKMLNSVLIEHPEDSILSDEGVMNEGYYSVNYGLKGIPSESEEIIVSRDVIIARMTGAKLHFAHISTKGGVEILREAKKKKIPVTAEVTPHHLILNESNLIPWESNHKMNPPLRSEEDRKYLIEALKDGTIDVIATDHAPHTEDEKAVEFNLAPFGVVGLETAVSLILDKLVHRGMITLQRMVDAISCRPAKILNLKGKGKIAVGYDGDLTLLNLQKEIIIDKNKFFSKGKNTPFHGWKLKGRTEITISGGRVVWMAKK